MKGEQKMNTTRKIIRAIMILLDRCPHCREKMLRGIGGKKGNTTNDFTVCPFKHFALERDKYDLIHVYDGGGKPLPIKRLNNHKEKCREKKTLY
jgi:hypothetical protein